MAFKRGFYYTNVPKLGNVAVSRHALAKMDEDGIAQESFEKVLLEPIRDDVTDGHGVIWRERDGIRIVILEKPTPFRGAKLVTTTYRIGSQESVK